MTTELILALLVSHFVGDFLLQSDWMAKNKSKRFDALFLHVYFYSICFFRMGPTFVVITGLLHFVTDFFTSRATAYLWDQKKVHWFFVMIGFDQLIHFFCLILLAEATK